MALKQGWKINYDTTVAVDVAADVSEGQLGKLTAESTAAIAGAGDTPAGWFSRDIDISEDGTRTELVRGDEVVGIAAAAVTINAKVKAAASGTVTPCTDDGDIIAGVALSAQGTVGGDVLIDPTLMGSYFYVVAE